MNTMRKIMLSVTTALLLVTTTGCEMAGFVADVVTGGGTLPAVYELPAKPTVIFVDDPKQKLSSHDLAGRIASRIGHTLTDESAVPQVISPDLVIQKQAENPDFSKWAIAKIGREVGAEQVVYVLITRYDLTADGQIYDPVGEVRVKVVDVDTGIRLFPKTPEAGYPVLSELDYSDVVGASTTDIVIGRNLADQLARDLSVLFYDHPKPQPGDKLPG